MRANIGALAALDTGIGIPGGDFQRDVALFPAGGCCGISSIHWQQADWQIITVIADHRSKHIAHKFRGFRRYRSPAGEVAGHLSRHLDFIKVLQCLIHCFKVALDNCFATLAVGFLDALLDLFNCFLTGQHATDGKEAGLHDGIDAPAHASLLCHLIGINHVETDFLVNDGGLDFHG